jgi:manganese/zinc/iron transport system permease protein
MMLAALALPEVAIPLTGALAALSATLLGTFLVLRGQAMLTDAISHSVVFGIVGAWLVTGATQGAAPLIGAAAAGLATVAVTEALARSGRVKGDAAVGLVFPALFAAAVLTINLMARDIHLDADSVLLGEIGYVWLDTTPLAGIEVPRAVVTLAVMAAVNAGFVLLFWKELKLATFDPALAAAFGLAPGVLGQALLALTSATAVASFDAVGAILFIAFVVVPPSTAFLLTRRLGPMLLVALAVALVATLAGYRAAVVLDVSIGGMMVLAMGLCFALALIASPDQGLVARARARAEARLARACDTLVTHLDTHAAGARVDEETAVAALTDHLHWTRAEAARVILAGLDRGLWRREGARLALTPLGLEQARRLAPAPPAD